MNSKAAITIFTADTGHTSIAQAVAAILKPQYQIHIANVSVPGFSFYYPFYRYLPGLTQIGYKASKRKTVYQAFQKFLGNSYRLKIVKTIAQDRPHLIISTYYPANLAIESVITRASIPFINILTDPRTIHPFLPSPHALNFVFDQTVSIFCRQHLKIPRQKLIISGWFIRPEYQPASKSKLRRYLKIPIQPLTFLVAAGSEGTNLVLKIIPTFLQASSPLTLFVACGHNKRLYEIVSNLNRANRLLRPKSSVKIIPLRFTDKLYQYIQASDLVVGKAGPNLLFETVACEVPFFAITHISGQEDGNLDIIREYNLGLVEENPIKANRALGQLIQSPQTLTDFKPSLLRLALHNRLAPQTLLQVINTLKSSSVLTNKNI